MDLSTYNRVRVLDERLSCAIDLVERAAGSFEDGAPDARWWRDYGLFTGLHMICTEDGWQPGTVKAELIAKYGEDVVLDEINA